MVIRKSSLPYPTSPPPPPPEPSTQPSHLHVDSTDIPPIPSSFQRPQAASQFEEMGNPWQDDFSPQPARTNKLPDTLKAGTSQQPGPSGGSLQILPDVLRPGWSGEATPRSSLDSDRGQSPEREWWDDDVVEDDKPEEQDASARLSKDLHVVNDTPSVAASSTIKRKPLPQSSSPKIDPALLPKTDPALPPDFASNNPYRRPSETFLHPSHDEPDWGSEIKAKAKDEHPHPLRSSPSTDELGRLALSDIPPNKPMFPPPPTIAPPPPPQQAPPPIPHIQEALIPSQRQPAQSTSWSFQKAPSPLPSPGAFEPAKQHNTVSTDDLLDRGHHEGSLSLRDELKALPNNPTAPRPSDPAEVSLLDDEAPHYSTPAKPPRPIPQESDDLYSPPDGPPPSHQLPIKPPRPAVVTSEHDLAQMREQRNEIYQIKHFNWYDMRTSRMRRSSMLTQNKNGPCPLLALVNALILGATEDMQAALDDALRLRDQVSLGLIIETLMDELLSRAAMNKDLQLPDVDELNRFLMRLRTGMNANPRFVPPSAPAPNLMDADTPTTPTAPQSQSPAGTFENTQDIRLYRSFRVKLIHGWLPRPNDQASQAFGRSAQTYEDAQAVQFGEEELEYKLSSGGLSQQEQQVWEDISSIKQFFQTYPTQLTPYGLGAVRDTLDPGEFAILFRNDHFSTIYKHPRDHRLYTLITDAGYADRDEIIWESLGDINGAGSEFFSGDFNSVSHGDTRHSMPHSLTDAANPRRASNQNQLNPPQDAFNAMSLTPQEQQEQADLDFALALQMQEEEEQTARRERAQQQQQQQQQQAGRGDRGGRGGRGGGNRGGGRGGRGPSPPARPQARRSGQGNIPIPLRSNPGGEIRPVIPPRNQNVNRNPAVNRPADADAVDAPPAYEEAARQSAYVPPVGSPLHPSSSTDLPLGRASTSTSNVHAQGQTTGVAYGDREPTVGQTQHRRRTSAYGENSDNWQYQSPDHSASIFGPGYAFMTPTGTEGLRRRSQAGDRNERDCVVM